VRCARKHLGWYAGRLPASARTSALRNLLFTEARAKEVVKLIPLLFGQPESERAAA
jgi:hypothetical protein